MGRFKRTILQTYHYTMTANDLLRPQALDEANGLRTTAVNDVLPKAVGIPHHPLLRFAHKHEQILSLEFFCAALVHSYEYSIQQYFYY